MPKMCNICFVIYCNLISLLFVGYFYSFRVVYVCVGVLQVFFPSFLPSPFIVPGKILSNCSNIYAFLSNFPTSSLLFPYFIINYCWFFCCCYTIFHSSELFIFLSRFNSLLDNFSASFSLLNFPLFFLSLFCFLPTAQ